MLQVKLTHATCPPGFFYGFKAAACLVAVCLLVPTNLISPLFPAGLDPIGVYLQRVAGATMWILGREDREG